MTPNPDFALDTALAQRLEGCADEGRLALIAGAQPILAEALADFDAWRADEAARRMNAARRLEAHAAGLEALAAEGCWQTVRDAMANDLRSSAAALGGNPDANPAAAQLEIVAQPGLRSALALLTLLADDPTAAIFRTDRGAVQTLLDRGESPAVEQEYQLDLLAFDDHTECLLETPLRARYAEASNRVSAEYGLGPPVSGDFPCDLYPLVSERVLVPVRYQVGGPEGAVAERITISAPGGRTQHYLNQPLPFVLEVNLLTGDKAQLTARLPEAGSAIVPTECSVTVAGAPLSELMESAPGFISCGGYPARGTVEQDLATC